MNQVLKISHSHLPELYTLLEKRAKNMLL